jgi:hypothetical protein
MACNNCNSHEWTVLEIRSQEDLAELLEHVNLSEVQVPSENPSVLNEIGAGRNCTAYILIPVPSKDPCDEPVDWTCLSANCPSECHHCHSTGHVWREDFEDCAGLQHVCCSTESHEILPDIHYDSEHIKHICKKCICL